MGMLGFKVVRMRPNWARQEEMLIRDDLVSSDVIDDEFKRVTNCLKSDFENKVIICEEGNCKVGIIGNYDIVVLAEKEIEFCTLWLSGVVGVALKYSGLTIL